MYSINKPPKPCTPPLLSTRLLDQLRERLRYMHYSLRTEEAYVYCLRPPRALGQSEVEAFLTHISTQRKVAVSTHRQALSALLFLYREVLDTELPWMQAIARPTKPRRLPSVLTRDETAHLLDALPDNADGLLARLLYGTGMRLMEGLRLRVKDVDFDRHVIIVREGKGGKDRVVMLPRSLADPLRKPPCGSFRLANFRKIRARHRATPSCVRIACAARSQAGDGPHGAGTARP